MEVMNSLQDLITLLDNAIKKGGGNLTLPVDGLPESETLVGYVKEESVTINNAKLASTSANVTVAGQVNIPSLKLTNVQATLTGMVENQAALLQLEAYDFPSGWNFTSSFPNLPQSEDFDSNSNTYYFKNSFLGELVLSSPSFTASTYADPSSDIVEGLNYSSGVAVTGPFKQIAHLISSVNLQIGRGHV